MKLILKPKDISIRPDDLEIQLSGLISVRFKFFFLEPGYLCLSVWLALTLRMENMCAYDVLPGPFPSFDCPYRTDHRQAVQVFFSLPCGTWMSLSVSLSVSDTENGKYGCLRRPSRAFSFIRLSLSHRSSPIEIAILQKITRLYYRSGQYRHVQ